MSPRALRRSISADRARATSFKCVTDDDVANAAFPFLAARAIALGFATAMAVRIGYVGELGYELYVPQEFAAHVYEALWQAGEPHGIANAGYRAIDSCRMEKGYLYWSGDITPDYNPYEAGLGFAVALDKGDFIGRDALGKISERGITRKLCSFTVDGFAPFHGGEAVFHDGRRRWLHRQRQLRPHAGQDHRLRLSPRRDRLGKGIRDRGLRHALSCGARPALPL